MSLNSMQRSFLSYKAIESLLKLLPFCSSLLLRTSDAAVPTPLGSLQGGEQMDTAKISGPEPLL